jgi:hypothetical protein
MLVVLAFGVASEEPMPNGEQFPWLTVRVLDEPPKGPVRWFKPRFRL